MNLIMEINECLNHKESSSVTLSSPDKPATWEPKSDLFHHIDILNLLFEGLVNLEANATYVGFFDNENFDLVSNVT